jgi:LmbE family N-acetylglucosaminyl deacetylase
VVSFDANGPGTSRAEWEGSGRISALPDAELSSVRRLLVVAAHPDDETLGCGGLVARAAALGVAVRIVAVTDGSASHPRSRTVSTRDLRARRAEELREAVARLAPRATISWLGFPDGRTADFSEAIEERLRTELQDADETTLVAVTWVGDGHRDHRVVGEIVERIAPPAAIVWSYPIWMWHWASPVDSRIPWDRGLTVTLDDAHLERKLHAIDAFASQVHPLSEESGDERVLEPGVLAHFTRDRETFFRVPERGAEPR